MMKKLTFVFIFILIINIKVLKLFIFIFIFTLFFFFTIIIQFNTFSFHILEMKEIIFLVKLVHFYMR
jgi:hypothetical protein